MQLLWIMFRTYLNYSENGFCPSIYNAQNSGSVWLTLGWGSYVDQRESISLSSTATIGMILLIFKLKLGSPNQSV